VVSEELELEELRKKARVVRCEPDELMLQRLRAGVKARLAARTSIWDVLATWMRPVAAVLAILILSLGIILTRQDVSMELLARAVPQLSYGAELYSGVE
jgi:hypothetical protein